MKRGTKRQLRRSYVSQRSWSLDRKAFLYIVACLLKGFKLNLSVRLSCFRPVLVSNAWGPRCIVHQFWLPCLHMTAVQHPSVRSCHMQTLSSCRDSSLSRLTNRPDRSSALQRPARSNMGCRELRDPSAKFLKRSGFMALHTDEDKVGNARSPFVSEVCACLAFRHKTSASSQDVVCT